MKKAYSLDVIQITLFGFPLSVITETWLKHDKYYQQTPDLLHTTIWKRLFAHGILAIWIWNEVINISDLQKLLIIFAKIFGISKALYLIS